MNFFWAGVVLVGLIGLAKTFRRKKLGTAEFFAQQSYEHQIVNRNKYKGRHGKSVNTRTK